MDDIAICVKNLSKLYHIGEHQPYKTLSDAITNLFTAGMRRLKRGFKSEDKAPNYIWALKDVSFEIKKGEVVGIIGRNGAGKSTLLKILSRITPPTEGYAEVRGRVGSLLEVGTGFHPELTGRDNIYLNGAILGMRKQEINRKFDEIVAFAELEKFIDTPVKYYSSGMYVRLAFAVAAHLEPEILLVDEVLAVGDSQFQKKCLGKMGDVAREGRTVLFVSHSMGVVNRLCREGIWLDKGQIQVIGTPEDVITAYLSMGAKAESERRWENPIEAPGNDKIRLWAVRVLTSKEEKSSTVDIRLPFYIEIDYEILKQLPPMRVTLTIYAHDGTAVFTSADNMGDPTWTDQPRPLGRYVSKCVIPGNLLGSGQYILQVAADIPFKESLFICERVLRFEVVETGGVGGRFSERWAGIICPALRWFVTYYDK